MSIVSEFRTKSTSTSDAPPRASASIAAEIARLKEDLLRGEARVRELARGYDAAIIAGDKEAEANEAESATTRRAVRRAELRISELNGEYKIALDRESEAVAQRRRDEANAAVKAVLAKLDKGYREPARLIAKFLEEYEAANDLALDAGVPSVHDLTRVVKGYIEPAGKVETFVYVDERGNECSTARPPGQYYPDAEGYPCDARGHRVPERAKRKKNILIDARRVPDENLPGLTTLINLPGAAIGEETIWIATALEQPR